MTPDSQSDATSNAARLSELRTLIANGLRDGFVDDNKWNEFSFLYHSTPNQERENLSLEYQKMLDVINDIRQRQTASQGRPLIQSLPMVHREPSCGRKECYR